MIEGPVLEPESHESRSCFTRRYRELLPPAAVLVVGEGSGVGWFVGGADGLGVAGGLAPAGVVAPADGLGGLDGPGPGELPGPAAVPRPGPRPWPFPWPWPVPWPCAAPLAVLAAVRSAPVTATVLPLRTQPPGSTDTTMPGAC